MSSDRLTLSIDTCVDTGSAVISVGKKVISESTGFSRGGGGGDLASNVNLMLKDCGLRIADIERCIVTRGPGSYTGVRTGLSFAKGLMRGGNIKVSTCLVTEALAMAVNKEHRTCVTILFAGKTEAAVQRFERKDKDGRFEASGPHRVYGVREIAEELAEYDGPVVAEGRVFDLLKDLQAQEGRDLQCEIVKAPDNVGELALRYLSYAGIVKETDLSAVYTREFKIGS